MNILFLCPRWPFPIRKGDQLIAFHRLRTLSLNHKITLVAFSNKLPPQEDIDAIAPFCESMHLIRTRPFERAIKLFQKGFNRKKPLQVSAFDASDAEGVVRHLCSSGKFDVIHAFLLRVAPYVVDYSERVVLELIDSMQLNFEKQISGRQPLWRRLLAREEASRLRKYEPELAGKFRHVTIVAERDKQRLANKDILVLPNGVEMTPNSTIQRVPKRIIFSGNMAYHANSEAAIWFVRNVWPIIRAREPEAEFRIVGISPTKEVRALAAVPGVTVTGEVPSLAAELSAASIAVAPMKSGSGIQNKVLEAMSCRLPVIVTSDALYGLPDQTRKVLKFADTPRSFAEAIFECIENPEEARQIGLMSEKIIRDIHSWESAAFSIDQMYEKASKSPAPWGLQSVIASQQSVLGPVH